MAKTLILMVVFCMFGVLLAVCLLSWVKGLVLWWSRSRKRGKVGGVSSWLVLRWMPCGSISSFRTNGKKRRGTPGKVVIMYSALLWDVVFILIRFVNSL